MKSLLYLLHGILLLLPGLTKAQSSPTKYIEPTTYCDRYPRLERAPRLTPQQSEGLKADRFVVSKSKKILFLLNQGSIIAEYPVAFGFGYKDGPKFRYGDGRTPEGLYEIEVKRTPTSYHLALQISYPNAADQVFAQQLGVDPGGSILLHGLPSVAVEGLDPAVISHVHPYVNWTQGCIAVTNQQVEEIYGRMDSAVPIEICPLN